MCRPSRERPNPDVVRVFAGPDHGRRRSGLIESYARAVADGDGGRVLYLVATEPLRREVLRGLVAAGVKGWGRLSLFLFADLVEDMAMALGLNGRRRLGPAGKFALISQIAKEAAQSGDLVYFRHMAAFPGFIRTVASLIGELKRAAATPESFVHLAQGRRPRDRELAWLYAAYQNRLREGGWVDAEDLQLLVRGQNGYFRRYDWAVIDGFSSVSPLQWEIMRMALETVPEVSVIACGGQRAGGLLDLIADFSKGTGLVEFEGGGLPDQERRDPWEEAWGGKAGQVRVTCLSMAAVSQEANEVARRIKRLVCSGEARGPGDVMVVVRDMDGMGGLIHAALARAGVPCERGAVRSVLNIPVVRLMRLVVSAARAPEGGDALVQVLNSDYIQLTGLSGVRKWALKEAIRLLGQVTDLVELKQRAEDRIAMIESLSKAAGEAGAEGPEDGGWDPGRERTLLTEALLVMEWAAGMLARFPDTGTMAEMTEALRDILHGLGVYRGIDELLHDPDLSKEAAGDRRALESCLLALDEAARAMGGARIDLFEFGWLLEQLLRVIPPLGDEGEPGGVRLLEAPQAVGLSAPVVFICGLQDGVFPRHFRQDWLYPDSERRALRMAGLPLQMQDELQDAEIHHFLNAARSAHSRLFLTWSRTGSDGSMALPSPFIEGLKNVVPPDLWEEERLSHGDEVVRDPALACTPAEFRATVIHKMFAATSRAAALQGLSGEQLAGRLMTQGVIPQDLLWRILVQERRANGVVERYNGVIDGRAKDAVALLFEGYAFSASSLNDYARCPFLFFCRRVLRLDTDPDLEETRHLLLGQLAHEALAETYRELRGQPIESWDTDAVLSRLRRGFEEFSERYLRQAAGLHPGLWALDTESLLAWLEQLVVSDITQAREAMAGRRPVLLEAEFGEPGDTPFVISGVRFRGKVDRIDICGESRYLVIDYKLKSTPSSRDIIQRGTDVQALLYLLAARDVLLNGSSSGAAGVQYEPSGSGYWAIKEGRKRGIWRIDRGSDHGVTRGGGRLTPEQWAEALERGAERLVSYAHDAMAGRFPPTPRDCRGLECPYADICRYDPQRPWVPPEPVEAGGDDEG